MLNIKNIFTKKKVEEPELTIEEKVELKDKTLFEKNRKNIKDLMASDYVDFSESPKYALVGDKYAKSMYVGIVPSTVEFPKFLDELYTAGNIDTTLHIIPIDSEQAKAELTKARTNLEVEFETAGGSNNRRDDMYVKIAEAKRLRDEVRDGENKIYECSIIATSYAATERSLENDCTKLKQAVGRTDVGLKSATYIQEDAFKSNKPLMKNYVDEWHTFDKRSLACTFPFTSSNLNHANGVFIGYNMDNGCPIMFDNFDRGLDNYNVVIFAKSGGGKSTFIKMLAARTNVLDWIGTIALDVEGEYCDIAEILGGVNITISDKSDTILNFFDVVPEEEKNPLNGKMREVINLQAKINSVTAILLTMAKGCTGSNEKFYDDICRSIIREGVAECYEDIGITDEAESLFEYRETKIDNEQLIGGKMKKEMPTISDWYRKLLEKAEKNADETYVPYYDYLKIVMRTYSKEQNGSFTCFDGQSTVKLHANIPFINFNVSKLNEETELPLAQHIICDFIWESIIKKNTDGRKLRCIIDEAWRLAKIIDGKPKYVEALHFIENLFRRARKKNTSAVIISQQFQEFYNEYTQSIIKNADTKVFLPPDKTSVDDITKVFYLTQGEKQYIMNIKRGEALFKCGNDTAKLRVDIPDFEMEFVETNQNKLIKEVG